MSETCPHCGGSGLVALGERQYDECTSCLTTEEKRAQGRRCGCRGIDDYCPCQNVPDRVTAAEWGAAP